MKILNLIRGPAVLGGLGLILSLVLSGCLNIKPAVDTTRYFVLCGIPAEGTPAVPDPAAPSLGLAVVALPEYLRGNRLASRLGDHEIRYHERFLWAEDLQKGLLRTLGMNLSRLLSTERIYLADWSRDAVDYELRLHVLRFESDNRGWATLEVAWSITRPGSVKAVRTGLTRLQRQGPDPGEDPGGAVAAMSALVADLSRELAGALKEGSSATNVSR